MMFRGIWLRLIETDRGKPAALTTVSGSDTVVDLIESLRHAGLERFFRDGLKAGINPAHARKLEDQLGVLNRASGPGDMRIPGWNLHALQGELAGHWWVKVNGDWRMTFRFEGKMLFWWIIRITTDCSSRR